MIDEPSHLQNLNPEQHRAVSTVGGALLVLAGAGSGKTRVLTRRIAHLLHCGVEPEQILAVTFTKKAAQEMKERVAELVGERGHKVWVSTFHASCCRILRQEIEALGFTKRFAIYDDDDQLRIIKELVTTMNLDTERLPPKHVLSRIDYFKTRGLSADDAIRTYRDHDSSLVVQVWRRYEEQLKAADALDFNDLIGHTVRLFVEHPGVLETWRDKFQYILVDEYQDTNQTQYALLRMLAGGHGNLAVVGDDDQSIYAFRGADITNILGFERDFPNATVIRLEQNYRSTGNILAVANTVVAQNRRRIAKRLWTSQQRGHPVAFRVTNSIDDEARLVARACRLFHQRDAIPFGDMAVVYRTNATARPFEAALRVGAVPYRVVGGRRFYERREVRDLLAYLRLVVNPADDAAFLRVVNVPSRGVGTKTLATLREAAAKRGEPLLKAARAQATGASAGAKALRTFVGIMDELSGAVRFQVPANLVLTAMECSGYRGMLDAEIAEHEARKKKRRGPPGRSRKAAGGRGPDAATRLENLLHLVRDAQAFEYPPEASGTLDQLTAWLDRVALAGQDEEIPEGGEVSLMTVHNAKGLEYPVVFAVQFVEGQFPHSRSVDQGIDEERRLAYVAFTRAKKRLVVTRSRALSRPGATRSSEPAEPSRFLFGLPDAACEGDRPDDNKAAPPSKPERPPRRRPTLPPRRPQPLGETPSPGALTKSTRVYHPRFGFGVVTDVSDPTAVTVRFGNKAEVIRAVDLRLVEE